MKLSSFCILFTILCAIPKGLPLYIDPGYDDTRISWVGATQALDNCSIVHLSSFGYKNCPGYTPRRWFITNLSLDNYYYPSGYVNCTRDFIYVDSWTNKVDELIYHGMDTFTLDQFVQVINLNLNTSYIFDLMSDFSFASYLNKEVVYMVDNNYPYQIFKGKANLKQFQQIFDYPPINLNMTRQLVCNSGERCMWRADQGIVVNYPMKPFPIVHSIQGKEIVKIATAFLDGRYYMYTGTRDGFVYQWIEGSDQIYTPTKVLFNGYGSPIRTILIIRNTLLIAEDQYNKKSFINLKQNVLTDAIDFYLEQNMTSICQSTAKMPIMFIQSRITLERHSHSALHYRSYISQYRPEVDRIDMHNYSAFRNVICTLSEKDLQVSPGLFAKNRQFDCYYDNALLMADDYIYNNTYYIEYCAKYDLSPSPTCKQCMSGYNLLVTDIIFSEQTTKNVTLCIQNNVNETVNGTTQNQASIPSSNGSIIGNSSNMNSTNTNTNSNTSTNGNNTNINFNTNTNSNSNSSSNSNSNSNANNADGQGNNAAIPESNQETNQDLYKGAENAINVLSQAIQVIKLPFAYFKNILQLTLFAFLIHSILSIWILASLYYFLPVAPAFVDYFLLILWKTYNISILALFGFQQPQLPRLNHQQSTMDFGEVTISNDFLEFTFDPFIMFIVATLNYFISVLLRKFLKCLFQSKYKIKLLWLKFEMFESVSDIVIQLLPVLFLPCGNFIYNPHYFDYLEKINLILFSTMGGVGVIFPFFYFSKLIKNKKTNQKNIQNKNKVEDFSKLQSQLSTRKEKRVHKKGNSKKDKNKKNRSKNRQKESKATKQNKGNNKQGLKKTYIQKIQSFLITRSKQIDDFLNCLLHLTIPISVTLQNNLPFFIANGVIIICNLFNSLLLTKDRLGIFLRRLYFLLYHTCFLVMFIYRQGKVNFLAGVCAIIIIAIYFIHEILSIIYRIILFLSKVFTDCRKKNQVDNVKFQPIQDKQSEKKTGLLKIQIFQLKQKKRKEIKQAMSINFKQFMQRKQNEGNKKNQEALEREISTRNGKQSNGDDFFKEQNQQLNEQLIDLVVSQNKKQKKKSRVLVRQRLKSNLNTLIVEEQKERNEDILESSQKHIADELTDRNYRKQK